MMNTGGSRRRRRHGTVCGVRKPNITAETATREFALSAPRLLVVIVAAAASALATPAPARAQVASRLGLGGAIEVGGEAERYLRVLQLSDSGPATPWTILPFSLSGETARMPAGAHPWRDRFQSDTAASGIRWLRPTAQATVNTTFPVQGAVGPVWAGRGGTISVQGGLAAHWRRVRLQLAPVAFLAQNAAFPLAPNGATGQLRFADARFPGNIDYPQRFGESAYGRVDAGTSALTVDGGALTAGVSSAPQRWGPAREYPLLLGPGAGGFPHAFVGTARPVDLWFARMQMRFIVGRLAQSSYSPVRAGTGTRFASATIFGFTPRGIDGLELGAARFFETTAPFSLSRALRPFDPRALVGAVGDPLNNVNVADENQMASAFLRWAFPGAGVEVYGEWYREDFPGDFRKFVIKPDDLSSFTVGFQRVFVVAPNRRRLFRFEIVNGELSHQERAQRGFDAPLPPYTHTEVVQGHTYHGLLLGSPEAYGGAGWRVAVDDYTPRGRVTIGLEQALRGDWLPVPRDTTELVHPDVIYAVRGELLRFAGGRDYTLVVLPAINLNRNLVSRSDRLNLNVSVRVAGW